MAYLNPELNWETRASCDEDFIERRMTSNLTEAANDDMWGMHIIEEPRGLVDVYCEFDEYYLGTRHEQLT